MSPLNWKGKPYRPVGGTGYIRVYKPDINELLKPLSQKKGLGSAILTGNAINPQNSPLPQNVTPTPTPSFTPTNTPTNTPTVTPSVTPTEPYDIYLFEECNNPSNKFRFEYVPGILNVGDVYYISGGTSGSCEWSANTEFWSGETTNWDVCTPGVFNGYASVITYSGTGTLYSASGVTFTLQGSCPGVTPTPTMTPTNTQTNTPTNTQTNTPTNTGTPTSTATPTNTSTNTPTPSNTPPASGTTEANAFLAAVLATGGTFGSSGSTISAATQTLFTSLVSNSLWDKIIAFYPFVGGSSASCAINGKTPGTYNITWNGGMTFDSNGPKGNGTNGYGDTNINDDTVLNLNDVHLSLYSITDSQDAGADFGVRNSGNTSSFQSFVRQPSPDTNNFQSRIHDNTFNLISMGSSKGYYIFTRTASNARRWYRNGTSIGNDTTTSVSKTNANIYFFARNIQGTGAANYNARQWVFASVGNGLTTTEMGTLSTIINTFETSLSRNTY